MPKNVYEIDQATEFGRWTDRVSKLMYDTCTKEILSLIEIPKIVADYGGANGNLKQYIPNAISIDIDESKKPDVLDDIVEHVGRYDLIVIRYVLHYLNDYDVIELFKNISNNDCL